MKAGRLIADVLTFGRIFIGLGMIWQGKGRPHDTVPLVAVLLLLSWTSDALDGPIARRSLDNSSSWIGEHDLEIDMFVGLCTLFYLNLAGFLSTGLLVGYLSAWAFVFWRWGNSRPLGMLFQAPAYAWLIWVGFVVHPPAGIWLSLWVIIALVITWPKFPQEIVPEFLSGIEDAFQTHQEKGNHDTNNGRPQVR